jgi:hypothetical protein
MRWGKQTLPIDADHVLGYVGLILMLLIATLAVRLDSKERCAQPGTSEGVMDATLFLRSATVDDGVVDELFRILSAELHRLVRRELNGQGPFVGLGVTTLLHEGSLKISSSEVTASVDRARFMAYAARVMRACSPCESRSRRTGVIGLPQASEERLHSMGRRKRVQGEIRHDARSKAVF